MTRAWTVTAAVLAFLHAGASALGAIAMGLTADNAEPMSTGEALGIAALVAVMAVATLVGAVLLLTWRPWTVLAAVVVSLVISAYVALRSAATPDAYQLPLLYAVLPAVVAVVVVVPLTARRRAVTATG